MKLSELVKERKIHHRLYSDPDIFELEMAHIFGRIWLFVAHESQLPEKGDYECHRRAKARYRNFFARPI